MSNQDNASGEKIENNVQDSSASQEQESRYVKKEAYEGVTKDLHKFKSRAKDAEARLAEYEAKLKAIEEEKMREQNQWKELYEKQKNEYEALETARQHERAEYLRTVKMNELRQELGGKVRPEYLVHANVENIEFNDDGSINKESLLAVANDFREKHSSLIPRTEGVNATAKGVNPGTGFSKQPTDLASMSTNDKIELLKSLKQGV